MGRPEVGPVVTICHGVCSEMQSMPLVQFALLRLRQSLPEGQTSETRTRNASYWRSPFLKIPISAKNGNLLHCGNIGFSLSTTSLRPLFASDVPFRDAPYSVHRRTFNHFHNVINQLVLAYQFGAQHDYRSLFDLSKSVGISPSYLKDRVTERSGPCGTS
jgi:hypothetical protein